MKHLISIILCLLTLSIIQAQNPAGDPFNLNFEKKVDIFSTNWRYAGRLYSLQIDSIDKVSGKKSLFISVNPGQNPKPGFKIYQTIFLPEETDSLSVSVYAKGESVSGATFKVFLIGSAGNIAFQNSALIKRSIDWRKYNIVASNALSRILYIEISVGENTNLWVDNIEISTKGKALYASTTRVINPDSETLNAIKNCTGLDSSETSFRSALAPLNSKKIIGIGESVHGSHEMWAWRNRIIKHLVQNQNCKLIILETGNDFVSYMNNFIQNKIDEKDFSLLKIPAFSSYYAQTEEIMELLRWLKEYNLSASGKVTIAGMDIQGNNYIGELKSILEKYNSPIFKALYQRANSDNLQKMIAENRNEITRVSSAEVYSRLKKLSIRIGQHKNMQNSSPNIELRDYCMFEIAKELIAKHTTGSEKTVVCAHLGHLNKQSFSPSFAIPTISLGNQLSDYYKDSYYVIAGLAGCGRYYAPNNHFELLLPPDNSIEKFCMNSGKDVSFIGVDQISKLSNTPLLCRTIGLSADFGNQFYPMTGMRNNFDAILFIKNDTPLRYLGRTRDIKFFMKLKTLSSNADPHPKSKPDLLSYKPVNLKNTVMLNGLFCLKPKDGIEFISTTDSLFKMIVDYSPAVSVEHFKSIEYREEANKKWRLTIKLDETGTKEFEKTTLRNLFKQIPLILNNQIIIAPAVSSVIKDGVISFSGLNIETIQPIQEYLKVNPIEHFKN